MFVPRPVKLFCALVALVAAGTALFAYASQFLLAFADIPATAENQEVARFAAGSTAFLLLALVALVLLFLPQDMRLKVVRTADVS